MKQLCLTWDIRFQPSIVISQGEEIELVERHEQMRQRSPQVSAATGESPATLAQKAVADIWRELLGVDQVGIHDNYFALGGDSLRAIQVISRLKQDHQVDLQLRDFFELPTIAGLADRVDTLNGATWNGATWNGANLNGASPSVEAAPSETRGWVSVVPLQPNGAKPPFFFLAGRSHFGDNLGSDQPVYRVVYQDLESEQAFVRVEDMAAHSINSMRTIQPNGPYYLGGHGLGGLVAFEVARQLQRQAEKVAMLALCEVPPLGSTAAAPRPSPAYRIWRRIGYTFDRGRRIGPRQQLAEVHSSLKRKAQRMVWRLRGVPPERPQESYQAAAHEAMRRYVPQSYSGRLTVVLGTERVPGRNDETLKCWGSLATGGVDAYQIPGSHTGIYQEPNVRMLARALNDVLRKAQAQAANEP